MTDVRAVMTGLGTRLATISGLRVHNEPPDVVQVPAAVVAFPDEIAYDSVMAGGGDDLTIPLHVVVAKVSARAAAKQVCEYLSTSGAKSIKAAIEGDKTLGGACDSVAVERAETSVMTIAGQDYLAATFTVNVVT